MMNGISFDDSYETSAPQWTDFSEITPNRNVEGDEYFDRIHDNLEALSSKNPEKRRNRWRGNVNTNHSGVSSTLLDTPKTIKFQNSEIESTFMDDIDKIRMTPIKVTSPRTKNKEPIVMQELSVNEVLSNAIKGLEIASSKSRNGKKSQILNATVCPSSTTNSKLTSSQRKIRISRSMHFQSTTSSNGKTPAAKAAATPRNIKTPNCKVPLIVIESEQCTTQTTDVIGSAKMSIEADEKCENNHHKTLSMCESSSTKLKTPKKLSRSLYSITTSTGVSAKKSNNSQLIKTPKTPKPTLPIETPEPMSDVDEIMVEHSALPDIANQIRDESMDEATVAQNCETSAQPNNSNASAEITIINASIRKEDEAVDFNIDACQSDDIDVNVDDDFQNHEHFNSELDYEDAFEVQRANNVEHRNYRHAKATVVTNPARRRSSILNRRRRSNKYISLAEAVSTFQRSTPTRFHTVSSKSGPLQRVKQASSKNTIPISPALKSKTRVRRNAVLNQAEREELELKNMRQHQVHANPVRAEILKAPETLKPVAKKPITVPKPFKLSGKLKSTQPSASTSSHSLSYHATNARLKRVMTLAPSEDSQSVEPQEIRDFGIPIMRNFNERRNDTKKKVTLPQPFSIDERHKQFLNKKEEKLKLLKSEEAKKNKFEFHARPVPAAVKKSSAADMAKEKLQKVTTSHVQVCPFSFEERNKMAAKKKEELRKKIEEEERKARIFHANPVPTFKPVAVRSVSRENLKIETKTKSAECVKTDGKMNNMAKSNENLARITRGKSADCLKPSTKLNVRNQSTENLKTLKRVNSHHNMGGKLDGLKLRTNSVGQIDDQENIAPNVPVSRPNNPSIMPTLKPKLKTLPIELHSDKRARLRREYDEKVRLKLEQDEERRRIEQENRLAREQAEIAEIRKRAEVKARPMPVYKPLVLAKSNKPLTDAESPAWSKMKR